MEPDLLYPSAPTSHDNHPTASPLFQYFLSIFTGLIVRHTYTSQHLSLVASPDFLTVPSLDPSTHASSEEHP